MLLVPVKFLEPFKFNPYLILITKKKLHSVLVPFQLKFV